MLKQRIALASLLMLSGAAAAQEPTSPPQAGAAKGDAQADAGKADAGKSGTSDFANQETYKMKDGGMYKPPAQRPASPAQDLAIYGRT